MNLKEVAAIDFPDIQPITLKRIEFPVDYPNLLKKDYERVKNGTGLVLTDQKSKETIRAVANWIIQKLKNTILEGQPIMNIALPVFISDYRSMLQVFAYELRCAPYFINRIQNEKDKLEKLKWASVFLVSQCYFSLMQTKPFNPIIGETYQCRIGDMNIYLEQTQHKPPTGNFYCFDDNRTYKFYGFCATTANTGANTCKAIKNGKIILEFKDGNKYSIYYPNVWISGTLFGKNLFNYKNVCVVADEVNQIASYMHFNPEAEKGFLKKLVSVKEDDYPDIIKGDIIDKKEIVFKKDNKHTHDKKSKSYSKISGFWTESLIFDGVKYWDRTFYIPLTMYEMEYKLPSDSSNRSDMKAWVEHKQEEAQAEKEKLEDIQRTDTKKRRAWEMMMNPHKAASPAAAQEGEASKATDGLKEE